ncbi:MAG: hypothetical protein AAFV93_13305 [Chloroflexota bacterium]
MKTSADVIKELQAAIEKLESAQATLEDLITVHDYQDVTSLTMQSANALLQSAIAFMQSEDETALNLVEVGEDLLEDMYNIIDEDMES